MPTFIIAVSTLTLLCAVYCVLRLIVPLVLPFERRTTYAIKATISALFLAVSQKFMVYYLVSGSISDVHLPYPILITWEWLFIFLVLTILLTLMRDGILLLSWIARRIGLSSFSLPINKQVAILFSISTLFASYGLWQATKVPDVRTVEISFPNLPEALDGFSIVHLTDTHVGQLLHDDWVRAVVAKSNALDADLVAFTGDFVDGDTEKLRHIVEPFKDLTARYGVYGVVGNHEYYSQVDPWVEKLKSLGFDMLINEHRTLSIGDASLILAGVTDPLPPSSFACHLPQRGRLSRVFSTKITTVL